MPGRADANGDASSRPKRKVVPIRLRVGAPEGLYRIRPFELVVRTHPPDRPGEFDDVAVLWTRDKDEFGSRGRIDTTMGVGMAAAAWAPLRSLLEADIPDRLELRDEEVLDLLDGAAERLESSGVSLEWDPDLDRSLGGKVVVGSSGRLSQSVPDVFDQNALQGFSWQLSLGGVPLSGEEMALVADADGPIIRLREKWVLVPRVMAERARNPDLKPLTAIDALSVALTGSTVVDGQRVEVEAKGWVAQLREQVTGEESLDQIDPPEDLNATLREYQVEGLRWLHRMTSLGLGGCLADDMGLGKTVMLISLHLHRRLNPQTAGPTLVVCPASLLGNWEREINRFAPTESVRRYHGPNRSLDQITSGFVLTTYGTMRLDAELFEAVPWGLLVADEAQHVKNPRSAGAKALRTIPARSRVALTGTPVENNLSELWAILDWTTPGLLGTLGSFRKKWADPIEIEASESATRLLNRLVRPFLLRRRKSDPGIAPELPPKTITDQPVGLSPEQVKLYEAAVRENMLQIRTADGINRRGLVLKLLTSLKQICNHPAQYLGEEGGKLDERSGKLELLDELLDTILSEESSVLVFTQYVAMAKLLARHLDERGIAAMLLHGGTAVRQRERMVERFQEGEVPVFLLSLKAAGTGLNLTRADHVIHFDRWWNPAVEEQATDRAHRIGQQNSVQVHRLIAEGTIEDRIASIHETKRELADAIVSTGEAALTELSNEDLAELVELRNAG
ncbi:MAG: DEAD/DEAH box helicase [Solirubrobacterales bacterium]|nr:DEAD/DEAH box helicase [Solirubrobacterales bacterium]